MEFFLNKTALLLETFLLEPTWISITRPICPEYCMQRTCGLAKSAGQTGTDQVGCVSLVKKSHVFISPNSTV